MLKKKTTKAKRTELHLRGVAGGDGLVQQPDRRVQLAGARGACSFEKNMRRKYVLCLHVRVQKRNACVQCIESKGQFQLIFLNPIFLLYFRTWHRIV